MAKHGPTSGKVRLARSVSMGALAHFNRCVRRGREPRALADGGTVRLSEMQGPYRITALTSPNPFRSGPVEINVLVQDATTGDALPDANVRLSLAARRT